MFLEVLGLGFWAFAIMNGQGCMHMNGQKRARAVNRGRIFTTMSVGRMHTVTVFGYMKGSPYT